MLLEVSSGEGFDKLSILEIKLRRIPDPEKREAVQKEIDALHSILQLKKRYPFEYGVLTQVNEEIWDLTDLINPKDPMFAAISERIFALNRKRFRVKRMINNLEASSLKEQKNTGTEHCVIILDVDPYSRINEIYSLAFEYDTISFDRSCRLKPFQNFVDTAPEYYVSINLSEVQNTVQDIQPITYASGGRLGDTIHQLSIVSEKYLLTGKKGIVYLSSSVGDPFDRSVERTYEDIREVISAQPYIQSLKVHKGEPYDVDLSIWRNFVKYTPETTWRTIYEEAFQQPWNTCPWISVEPDLRYKNTTFLSIGPRRYNSTIDFRALICKLDNPVFLTCSRSEYETFVARSGVTMPCVLISSFTDIARAIKGCKLFVGSMSMPLTLADAMYVRRVAVLEDFYKMDAAIENQSNPRCIVQVHHIDAHK
jgi:hypothetical protein